MVGVGGGLGKEVEVKTDSSSNSQLLVIRNLLTASHV